MKKNNANFFSYKIQLMYSQTMLYAITHVGVGPNETRACMSKSISLIPRTLALIIIPLA